MMNIKLLLLLLCAGVIHAGQLPPVYSLESTRMRYVGHGLPEITIEAARGEVLVALAGGKELRLHERAGFDLRLPFRSPPDVRALETPAGLCVSIYFEMVTGNNFYLYIIEGDAWVYEIKEPGSWFNWATGDISLKAPDRIQAVFDLLRQDASPSSDPFAAKPTRSQAGEVAPKLVNPSAEAPASR